MAGTKGRSGRPNKPIEVLKMQRTYKPERHRNATKAKPGTPICPVWLGKIGKQYWSRTVKQLREIPGLLTQVDRDALAAYCDAWETYHAARDAMDSVIVETDRGPRKHPSLLAMKEAMVEIKHFCREFGLTPSARAALPQPPPAEEENPIEAIVRRGRA